MLKAEALSKLLSGSLELLRVPIQMDRVLLDLCREPSPSRRLLTSRIRRRQALSQRLEQSLGHESIAVWQFADSTPEVIRNGNGQLHGETSDPAG